MPLRFSLDSLLTSVLLWTATFASVGMIGLVVAHFRGFPIGAAEVLLGVGTASTIGALAGVGWWFAFAAVMRALFRRKSGEAQPSAPADAAERRR